MIEKNGNTKVTMLKLWTSLIDLLSTQKHCVTQGNKPLSRVYSKNEWVIKSMLCYGAEIWGFHKGFEVEKVHII